MATESLDEGSAARLRGFRRLGWSPGCLTKKSIAEPLECYLSTHGGVAATGADVLSDLRPSGGEHCRFLNADRREISLCCYLVLVGKRSYAEDE